MFLFYGIKKDPHNRGHFSIDFLGDVCYNGTITKPD